MNLRPAAIVVLVGTALATYYSPYLLGKNEEVDRPSSSWANSAREVLEQEERTKHADDENRVKQVARKFSENAESKQSYESFKTCTIASILALDDGISDAKVIVQAAISACDKDFQGIAIGLQEDNKFEFLEQIKNQLQAPFTETVLANRIRKREKKSLQQPEPFTPPPRPVPQDERKLDLNTPI